MSVHHAASDSGISFWIHVSPGARRETVGGGRGDALRVAVSAPPVDGRANAGCVDALAAAFGVRRSAVRVDPASRGRRKRAQVDGDPAALAAQLAKLAGST